MGKSITAVGVGACVAILTLLSILPALGQTPDTSTIQGVVNDQTHAAISGVEITLTNNLTSLKRKVQTDASGRYSVAGLPVAGSYNLTARKQGFADGQLDNIQLVSGATANLDLQLNASGGQTEISVTGVAGEVRTDQPQLGTWLSTRQIEETPLLNRRITALPLLNAANRPAINQGDIFINQFLFTTNGTGRRQAWYEVDGSNAVDAWGRQTIFATLPLDSLDEMAVLTNSFSAEYGMTAGSVVNIVTKSGGNKYHGNLLALWRPADTSASLAGYTTSVANGNFLTSDELTQAAASLSGPIGSSEKTHFSASGEYSWENKGSPITSPLAPGTYHGHYRGWLGFARLDHEINEKHTLFLRANADNFTDTNPNGTVGGQTLPSVARVFHRRAYSAEIGETANLSPTLLNSVRFQFQLASPITQFDPVVFGTQFVVPITSGGTFTSGTSQSALLQNRQYEFNDTVSTVHGRHTLKFGGDVIRAHNGGNSKEFGGPIFLGQFTFNPCTGTLAFCESQAYIGDINNVKSYTQSYGNGSYTVDDTIWALFVQDDIKVRRDLTVNLGLRYDRQTFTDSTKDFAPRVGFAYDIHGWGKSVLRGGFGIYYSQIVDNAQANYSLTGPTGVFNYTAQAGQVGFPTSISAAPLPAFPPGAQMPLRTLYIRPGQASYYDQFFPTSTLKGYPDGLFNPYTEQWTLGFEHELARNWVLSVDYVGSHTAKINRPLDLDSPAPFVRTGPGQTRSGQAANCTRPFWIWWYNQNGLVCDPTMPPTNPQPPYSTITSDVNNGSANYNALDLNLNHRFSHNLQMLASYTWSHAIDTVDPDIPGQNPNDPNFTGQQEVGNAIFDQRQRFVLSGSYIAPLKIVIGGVGTLASGLPYNIVTGANNFGAPGTTTDRPVVNGAVISRNAGRGNPIYDVSPFVERAFPLFSERVHLNIRAEAFNVFNHRNVVGYNGTFGNGATPPVCMPGQGTVCFGGPNTGITNQLPARSLQFSARVQF
ncbi:MAG TPA: TonB-dependent receptor [Terriglobales bacterium]|nr:TonB-dependent receptor [Terriglobales bacterium]